VVPGTAFDKKLNRVGYGKGFYDRFLNSVNAGLTVGFAFECQLFETIDCEPHDVPADILITENNIYRRNS
jgi:5-formyltetrahydrofolate cyclo-ligase